MQLGLNIWFIMIIIIIIQTGLNTVQRSNAIYFEILFSAKQK